jgi:hypothetical protein
LLHSGLRTVGETLYHVELRHFPRNVCRFNLSAEELHANVLEPWVTDRMFELGELRWDPRQARLTVLEGPRLAPSELTMGRGWRAAQRHGQDVTERLLAAAREELAQGVGEGAGGQGAGMRGQGEGVAPGLGGTTQASRSALGLGMKEASRSAVEERAGDLAADSLGLELLAQIGPDQTPLRRAWELAAARDPSAPASDALALAERTVASLLRARLVALLRAEPSEASAKTGEEGGAEADPRPVREEDAAAILRAIESWTGDPRNAHVYLRRA